MGRGETKLVKAEIEMEENTKKREKEKYRGER